ncbi:MAG TPA: hypothetical protein PK379_03460 [Candidatus Hydrogenedentes bacterium]|nr:hypothetical protein [Candidatus Hydrogenedentota bacterium]HOK89060.1 hypothetical protein [Candidatus Hydrogenedentota bacterium]
MTSSTRQQHDAWWVPVVIMGTAGLFFWAIRGSAGYGGETGGMLAGSGWGLLWWMLSRSDGRGGQRPYGSPWALLALAAGIAYGGFTGYGVYVGWVKGAFYLDYPNGARPINPLWGYVALFLCGLHWGGNTGVFLSWCAPERPMRARDWIARIASGVAGAVIALGITKMWPQWFLPFYSDALYGDPANRTCARAINSLWTIAPHIGTLAGFLAYELFRRDTRAVKLITLMALGFAVPFAVGGIWHAVGEGSAIPIDWWKNWEMSIGLGGGMAIGLAFVLFNRPLAGTAWEDGPWTRGLFATGLAPWFCSLPVLQGAYDGLGQLWGYEPGYAGYLALALLAAMPWLARWMKKHPENGYPGEIACLLLLGLIVLCGYAVTLPPPGKMIRPATSFLLALYTLCLATTGWLYFWRVRSRGSRG